MSASRRSVCGFVVAATALAMTGCPLLPAPALPAGTRTTIIIIRHAERNPGLDPPLNDEGLARAEVLREVLGEQGVTAIYCTDLIRNRQTVQPLADDLGLPLNTINPALYVDTVATADSVVNEILRDHAGGTILFCGNIGSVFNTPGISESIYRRLGGTGRTPVRYQDFYVVVVESDGPAHFMKAEYGERSSLDP